MLDILFLNTSGFFQNKTLNKGEVLFDEGDFDENLYIIITGGLTVNKYTTSKRTELKTLTKLKQHEVFGEAALNTNTKKEVQIVANRKTHLLYINAKKGLSDFSEKYPTQGLELLKYIIFLSNKRLIESNYLITAQYKISKEILKLKSIDNKGIFGLIDKIEEIVGVDHIVYLEKNIVMENYLTIRYDSSNKGKMLDTIIETTDNKLNLLELQLSDMYSYVKELNFGDKHLGYLVFFKKNEGFQDNDKKILTSIAIGISGVIKEKQLLNEERDKDFMKN